MKVPVRKLSSVQLFVLFATFLLCFLPLSAVQAAVGTCQARYEVVVTHVNGRPMNEVIHFGEFQSHGRGRFFERATRRAKKNAERCMQSQWYSRQSGIPPFDCQDQQRISGYRIEDFQRTLRREICQALKPLPCNRGRADIRYSIFAVVDGGAGCGTGMSPVSRTLLDSGMITQCKCRQPLPEPQLVSPVQGTTFYHLPRRTLVTWQPVPRARGYAVEVEYNGRLWRTLNTTGEATFVTFDFPGPGRGRWRVFAQDRRGMSGPASPWSGFFYQR
jgi:hypothetical protein